MWVHMHHMGSHSSHHRLAKGLSMQLLVQVGAAHGHLSVVVASIQMVVHHPNTAMTPFHSCSLCQFLAGIVLQSDSPELWPLKQYMKVARKDASLDDMAL